MNGGVGKGTRGNSKRKASGKKVKNTDQGTPLRQITYAGGSQAENRQTIRGKGEVKPHFPTTDDFYLTMEISILIMQA